MVHTIEEIESTVGLAYGLTAAQVPDQRHPEAYQLAVSFGSLPTDFLSLKVCQCTWHMPIIFNWLDR